MVTNQVHGFYQSSENGVFASDGILPGIQETLTQYSYEALMKGGLITTISTEALLNLRFSQQTIEGSIRSGQTLNELGQSILKHGWDTNHPLNIVAMPDSEFTSLDNRRLYVLKHLIQQAPMHDFKVNVSVYFWPDRATSLIYNQVFTRVNSLPLKEQENIRNKIQSIQKILPGSYGECVVGRMHGLDKSVKAALNLFSSDEAYGFINLPRVLDFSDQKKITIHKAQERFKAIK